ncbi:MAG: TetR/AcrR family transcriptional regulator [Acidimicrobiales bacterium]
MLRSVQTTTPAVRRAPATRMSRIERCEHLLDAAAELIAERGVDGVTMEGVAARAGVSKALPYKHFEDATELLVRLKDRELLLLGQRVAEALAASDDFEEQIRLAARAAFSTMRERASILPALVFTSLPPGDPDLSGGPVGNSPMVQALQRGLDVRPSVAIVLDAAINLGLVGGYLAWKDLGADLDAVEAILVRMVVGGAVAVAGDDRSGKIPPVFPTDR